MDKKWILIGAVVFIAFIIGMIYLAGVEENNPQSGEDVFVGYATELGLDAEQFLTDLRSDDAKRAVTRGIAAGNADKASSTPTILINGEINRPATIADFQIVIDELVAKGEKQELPEGFYSKGAAEPLVVIEEYSDFQCPACRSTFPLLKQIVEDNLETTALVYKHFPLTQIHPKANLAARVSEAAGKQGKFWEMHDMLFEKQNDWK